MVKKIVDIIPPNSKISLKKDKELVAEKKEHFFKFGKHKESSIKEESKRLKTSIVEKIKVEPEDEIESALKIDNIANQDKKVLVKRIPFKSVLSIVVLIALVSFSLFLFVNLPKAEIQIYPKTEIKTFKTSIIVDQNAKEINFKEKTIPGELFEDEEKVLEEFYSTGNLTSSEKASGNIRVYNKYSKAQTLVKGTRFQPPLEKFKGDLDKDLGEEPYFKSTESVVVPAKSYIDVEVVADSSGEKYNIEPSIFSIPGLAGTAVYTFVYGESSDSMTGGFEERSNQITKLDIDKADQKIREVAIEKAEEKLKDKINLEFELIESAINSEVTETSTSVKEGMSLEKFNYKATSTANVIVFKKADLDSFVKEFVDSELEDGKEINEESLIIKYTYRSSKNGTMDIALEIEAEVYSSLNKNELTGQLKGKTINEAKTLLENNEGIDTAKVSFWPFWVSSVPNKNDKIGIEWVFK